jgi:hypothetical protein
MEHSFVGRELRGAYARDGKQFKNSNKSAHTPN